jgi:hypothetical protein
MEKNAMFKTLKIGLLILSLSGVITSCSSNVEGTNPPSIEPAEIISRLIFTSSSNIGDVKIEMNEPYIERVLDGNPDWVGLSALSSTPYSSVYPSDITINVSNLYYDGEEISSVLCDYDENNKIDLIYTSSMGDLYMGPNSKFYRYTPTAFPPPPPYLYADQELDENILSARLANFYLKQNCTGSDGKVYEVSFYPSTNPLSHNITTSFSIDDGSISGIIRVHQEGNGHVPFVDMLFY